MSAGSSLFRSLAALLLGFIPALASYPKQVILADGDVTPGLGSDEEWASFDAAYIDDDGVIVVDGSTGWNRQLVLRNADGALGLRARRRDPVTDLPSDQYIDSFLTSPVMGHRGTTLVFGVKLAGAEVTSSNSVALVISDSAGLRLAVRQGDPIPGRSDFIKSIGRPRLDQNLHLTFTAIGVVSNRYYLLRWTPEGITELFPREGEWLSNTHLGVVLTRSTGTAVIDGTFGTNQSRNSAIFEIDAEQQVEVARGGPVAGSQWTFTSPLRLESTNNRGDILFTASATHNTTSEQVSGLWLRTGTGELEFLAAGVFKSAIINGQGDIAAHGSSVFFKPAGGNVVEIVPISSTAPTVASITPYALFLSRNRNVVFATNDTIWVHTSEGKLRPIAKAGEVLEFRGKKHTLGELKILISAAGGEDGHRRALSDNGKIVFLAQLTPLGQTTPIDAVLMATLPYGGEPGSPPIANADFVPLRTPPGIPVIIDVLSNDFDEEGDPLTIQSVSPPVFGKAVIRNGRILYTPDSRFRHEETLTYRITDGAEHFTVGTVTIRHATSGNMGTFRAVVMNSSTPIGNLTLTASRAGQLSGRLDIRGETFVIRGLLPASGEFARSFTLKSGETLQLSFRIVPSNAQAQLVGSVETSTGESLSFHARAATSTSAPPAIAKRVTAHFRVDAGSSLPKGVGFAAGTISANGRVVLTGRLPDNRPFTAGTVIQLDGTIPFTSSPYGPDRGSVAGTFNATPPGPGYGQWISQLQWEKAAPSAGFSGGLTGVIAPYGPAPGEPALQLGTPVFPVGIFTAQINGQDSVDETLTWSERDVIDFTYPNLNAIRLKVNRATGLVNGTFRGENSIPVSITGAILQSSGEAAGIVRQESAIGSFAIRSYTAD